MVLEDPSLSEIIRDIDERTKQIQTDLKTFVRADLYEEQRRHVLDRLTALENKGRQWWTLFALPAMVALFVWLIQEAVK